jgi:hypothetical protein
MNSRERVYARLAGKPVDKIPNLNIYMYIVAREAGVSYREFLKNYRKPAEGNLICAEESLRTGKVIDIKGYAARLKSDGDLSFE